MWQVAFGSGNWLAHLGRKEGGGYAIDFRWRYYRDDKLLPESKDVLRYYHGEISESSDAAAIEHVRQIYGMVRSLTADAPSWELLRGARSMDEFTQLLMRMPGMHVRVEGRTH